MAVVEECFDRLQDGQDSCCADREDGAEDFSGMHLSSAVAGSQRLGRVAVDRHYVGCGKLAQECGPVV